MVSQVVEFLLKEHSQRKNRLYSSFILNLNDVFVEKLLVKIDHIIHQGNQLLEERQVFHAIIPYVMENDGFQKLIKIIALYASSNMTLLMRDLYFFAASQNFSDFLFVLLYDQNDVKRILFGLD